MTTTYNYLQLVLQYYYYYFNTTDGMMDDVVMPVSSTRSTKQITGCLQYALYYSVVVYTNLSQLNPLLHHDTS